MTAIDFYNSIDIESLDLHKGINSYAILDNLNYNDKIQCESGCTKVVFIDRTHECDFVIKIPVSREEYGEDEYENAAFDCGWNYCEAETEFYHRAEMYSKECGQDITPLFLKTEFLTSYNDYPIYVQPKCDFSYSGNDDDDCLSKQDRDTINSYISKASSRCVDSIDYGLLEAIFIYYGATMLMNFISFIKEYSINDIHGGNWSRMNDGRPVVFDYSGFRS